MKLSDSDRLAQAKALLGDTKVLVLVTGTLQGGQAHYAYASIPVEHYLAFKHAESQGNYNLADFGMILAHGPGAEPEPEVRHRMEEEHGADHLFEAKLAELLQLSNGA